MPKNQKNNRTKKYKLMCTIVGIEVPDNECENCGEISDELVDGLICPNCWMELF